MTVKKSPSDNGDCQPHTEQDTFNLLKRKPVMDVYSEYTILLRDILSRQLLSDIDSHHPEIEAWLESSGWTLEELLSARRQWQEVWATSTGD